MKEIRFKNIQDASMYNKGYEQGKADAIGIVENMLSELPTINGYIDSAYLWLRFDKLKEQNNE